MCPYLWLQFAPAQMTPSSGLYCLQCLNVAEACWLFVEWMNEWKVKRKGLFLSAQSSVIGFLQSTTQRHVGLPRLGSSKSRLWNKGLDESTGIPQRYYGFGFRPNGDKANTAIKQGLLRSLGLQGDQISQSWRKSVLNIHWKDWCWSWNSNTLATWCEELTHWKRPWCWERLKAGGERDDGGQDGWMASLT